MNFIIQMKAYKEYERNRKPLDALTDEDKFLFQVNLIFYVVGLK